MAPTPPVRQRIQSTTTGRTPIAGNGPANRPRVADDAFVRADKQPGDESIRDDELDTFIAEFDRWLKIDRNDLDNVVEDQAQLSWKVGDRLALQVSRRDYQKNNIKELEARTARRVREEAVAANEKITDKATETEVLLDPDVIMAKTDLRRLEYGVDRLQALVRAFDQRKDMVQDCCRLYLAQYYTDTGARVPNAAKNADASHVRETLAQRRRGES